MALKSKFERIDQSKLKQGARDVLAKMKDKSENFTNAEVNKKIEPAIDKLIERLKKENPDALKKASATRTRKPKTTAKKKATKKAPAKTSGAKRETVMTVAKRIRKDGEKWQDALKRAKSEMGKDTKNKVSAVKTEVDKLKQLIEKDAVLKGFSNSELQRDAVRKAKPRGKRKTSTKGETTNQYGTYKNKVGRTYWESRENRSDRYAPKYPKNKPFLEMGGDITDAQDLSMANSDFLVMAKGGEIDAFTMSMVKGVDDGVSEIETKDLKARMEKGGTLESKFDGYETMYKYALANNFTPRQLAEELRFMTNIQIKADKELYDFLNNLSNMFPDTPISEFQKGGRLKSALIRDRKYYNKNEAWERAYNKGKSRRGYKEDGGTIENSIQSYQNHYKGFPSYEDGGTITDSTQHFRIMETDTPIYKEGGQIDMDL